MLKSILFDFDGVIAESVDVKTDAFRALFGEQKRYVNEIAEFHIRNGGMSRYDKFKFIYKDILKKELSKNEFHSLCDRFSELVVEKVVESSFVKGAEGLLARSASLYKLFVVSGTPQDEIRQIVKRRKIDKYFAGVFGSPETKTDLINSILKSESYYPQEAIFIGDSINDLEAAANTGTRFIARITEKNYDWAKDKKVERSFKDMRGVIEYIEKSI